MLHSRIHGSIPCGAPLGVLWCNGNTRAILRNVAYWDGAWFGTRREIRGCSIHPIPTILRTEHDGHACACKAFESRFDSYRALHLCRVRLVVSPEPFKFMSGVRFPYPVPFQASSTVERQTVNLVTRVRHLRLEPSGPIVYWCARLPVKELGLGSIPTRPAIYPLWARWCANDPDTIVGQVQLLDRGPQIPKERRTLPVKDRTVQRVGALRLSGVLLDRHSSLKP